MGSIRLWDMSNLEAEPRILSGGNWSNLVEFSEDGQWLVSDTAVLWRVQLADLQQTACQVVGRNLGIKEWQQFMGKKITTYRRTCAEWPIHSSVIDEAESLAKAGKLDEAVVLFGRIFELDPSLVESAKDELLGLSGTLPPSVPPTRGEACSSADECSSDSDATSPLAGGIEGGRDSASLVGGIEGGLDSTNPTTSTLAISHATRLMNDHTTELIDDGKTLALTGELDQAIAKFREAINIDSSLRLKPEAHAKTLAEPTYTHVITRISLFMEAENTVSATATITEAFTLAEKLDSAESWHQLCWVGVKHGFSERALLACNEAITLDETNGLYYNTRSLIHMQLGELDKAQADMERYEGWLQGEE
ncbi:tetratricopeptide repeat protein [Anaerolineales bacterium HSG25]|nr:tetratricopeptide repeat protein [Anaerolineales bacterium HSG25]